MGDETDHQSVQRRLSEDKSIGDHTPMQKHDDESTSGAAVPPKEWVKFDEEGSSASGQPPKKNISPGDESTLNNNSQVTAFCLGWGWVLFVSLDRLDQLYWKRYWQKDGNFLLIKIHDIG